MPAIPGKMRAVVIDRFGGPEVLEVREVPVPDIGKDEVLIALEASGVGSWDAEVRGAGGPRASRLPADPGD